ncbi:hypothetical protein T440DRAFT_472765 [Plenodomus tracheiphilus IPT5]|uniref:Uncharacterized protein n=1 Tax=Plenodomus tracheiphilus IPT5 TaxID=1408161 RepID=A0A6A7AT06_9PLEO|nr:hypothetical protein T440DRAFT_472765 [Plenodomus tracheiphilus IPT5]
MTSAISFDDANAGFQAGIVNGPVSAAFHLTLPEFSTGRVQASANKRPRLRTTGDSTASVNRDPLRPRHRLRRARGRHLIGSTNYALRQTRGLRSSA